MPLYDRTSDIPFEGDARKYLLGFCRASRDLKLRQLKHIRWEGSRKFYQSEADKWAACTQWLEGL